MQLDLGLKSTINGIEYFTVSQAAQFLGLSRQRVHQLIVKNHIKAIVINNCYYVACAQLNNIPKGQAGRPKKRFIKPGNNC